MSKGFGPLGVKGSTQEKSRSVILRFGCGEASSDKKEPDPVLRIFAIHLFPNESLQKHLKSFAVSTNDTTQERGGDRGSANFDQTARTIIRTRTVEAGAFVMSTRGFIML